MILSNVDIHSALDAGHLQIEPEPSPRFPSTTADCPYDTCSVNLRLSSLLQIPRSNQAISINLAQGKITELLLSVCDEKEIDPDGGYSLPVGKFVLGQTIERISLPINPDAPCYAARIEGRSSFARAGLIVHFTAPTIHAGFEGRITLEIINHGPYPIVLYPDMQICQLIVEQVSSTPFENPSDFQGQMKPSGT